MCKAPASRPLARERCAALVKHFTLLVGLGSADDPPPSQAPQGDVPEGRLRLSLLI